MCVASGDCTSSARLTAWLRASSAAEKRRLLQILCLNFTLVDATLVPTMRKPFDILAQGQSVPLSRGDSLCTFVNETVGSRLLLAVFPQTFAFKGDAVLSLVKPGLYRKHKP